MSTPLDTRTLEVIASTAPILDAHAEALTTLFYTRMFEHNPEVRPFFNPAHQQKGVQQRALAGAIVSYARHIHRLEELGSAVELIAHKHASLGVRPEHYPIVGEHLIAALSELLGDQATPEILEAWTRAYNLLAHIMIGREQELYATHETHHGWVGFRPFEVTEKVVESAEITSFYLSPVDHEPLAPHRPGQYLTLRVPSPLTKSTMRQYSISCAPNAHSYRISVKREDDTVHPGYVSNWLHAQVQQGDVLEVAPPCGEFVLDTTRTEPLVLLAGGVGITPLLAMMHAAAHDTTRPIYLVHAVRDGQVRAFREELDALVSHHSHLHLHTCYEHPTRDDREQARFDSEGRLSYDVLEQFLPPGAMEVYFCGPLPFMKAVHGILDQLDVPPAHIHHECFGPLEPLS